MAFTRETKIKRVKIFNNIQKTPGKILNGKILIGLNQPPKKRTDHNPHKSKMFAYSANQNMAYIMPEYSV